MSDKTSIKNSYKEKLYKELDRIVNKGQNISEKLTLEQKLTTRISQIKPHLFEKENYIFEFFIIQNSLFFIKDNEFKTGSYFSLINNEIYKCFYELVRNPTEDQFKSFQSEFQNLDNGGDIIYLLSKKICDKFNIGEYDLFFSIIIKDNIFRLEKLLQKNNIKENYDKIINKLITHKEIKSNWANISLDESYNFFINAINEPQNQIGEDNNFIFNENKENEHRDTEVNESINSGKTSKKTKKKKANNISKQVEEGKITNINNVPQNELTKENNYVNKFVEYLKKVKKRYQSKCSTPILDFLINTNGKLKHSYFRFKKDKDSFIDHLDENLNRLIYNFKIGSFNEDIQGYFCFKDEINNRYVETLYSNVELDLLVNKITSDNNFPKDDFTNPDLIKAKNAFKSRALSFEYYINYNIIIDKFKMIERPRVFYPFKSLEAIQNGLEDYNMAFNLVEVDGVILEKKDINLSLEKNAFIIDELYKIGKFMTQNNQIEVEPYIDKVIDLKKNELCIIEIKNQFPPSSIETDSKDKQPTRFYQMIKEMINKAKIIKEFYDFKNEKVESIRLILFYDAIHKENYYDDLSRAFSESFNENDELQFLFQFQCIYIKSSYLAACLFNMNDKYKMLKLQIDQVTDENKRLKMTIKESHERSLISQKQCFEEIEKLKEKINNYSKENLNLKIEFNKFEQARFKETSNLKQELILSTNALQNIKDEYTASQKKNLDEINNSSKEMAKLKIDFFNKDEEKSKEILELKGEINKLSVENFSLRDEIFAIKKNIEHLVDNKEKTSLNIKQISSDKITKKDKIKALISKTAELKMEKDNFEKSLFKILDEEK